MDHTNSSMLPMPTASVITITPQPVRETKQRKQREDYKVEKPSEKWAIQFGKIPHARIGNIINYPTDVERHKIMNEVSARLNIHVKNLTQVLQQHGISRSDYKSTPQGTAILKELEKETEERLNLAHRTQTQYLNTPAGSDLRNRLDALHPPYTITEDVYKAMAQIIEYLIRSITTFAISQARKSKENLITPKHVIDGINPNNNPEIRCCTLYRAMAIFLEGEYEFMMNDQKKKNAKEASIQHRADEEQLEETANKADELKFHEVRTPEEQLIKFVHEVMRFQIGEEVKRTQEMLQQQFGNQANILRDANGLPKVTNNSLSQHTVSLVTNAAVEMIISTLSSAASIRTIMNNNDSSRPKVTTQALLSVLQVFVNVLYAGEIKEELDRLNELWRVVTSSNQVFKNWRNENTLSKAVAKKNNTSETKVTIDDIKQQNDLNKKRTSAIRALGPNAIDAIKAEIRQKNPNITDDDLKEQYIAEAVRINDMRRDTRNADNEERKKKKEEMKLLETEQQKLKRQEAENKAIALYNELSQQLIDLFGKPLNIVPPPVMKMQTNLITNVESTTTIPQPFQPVQPMMPQPVPRK